MKAFVFDLCSHTGVKQGPQDGCHILRQDSIPPLPFPGPVVIPGIFKNFSKAIILHILLGPRKELPNQGTKSSLQFT
jgi:hypothetical protein